MRNESKLDSLVDLVMANVNDGVSEIDDSGSWHFTSPSREGRNSVVVATHDDGTKCVVKKALSFDEDHGPTRAGREANALIKMHDHPVHETASTPELLHQDPANTFLILSHVEHVSDLAAVAGDSDRCARLDHKQLGQVLAGIHESTRLFGRGDDKCASDTMNVARRLRVTAVIDMPTITWLDRASIGEIEAIAIVRSDVGVTEALTEMVTDCASSLDIALLHGDFRYDQILRTNDTTPSCCILDWEDCGVGDVAIDLGTLLGQDIAFTIKRRVETLRTSGHLETRIEEDDLQMLVGDAFVQVCQTTRVTWKSYWLGRGVPASNDCAKRAVRVAGWHLFDRVLAVGAGLGRVDSISRGMAGIGRELLVNADRYTVDLLGAESS